MLLKGYGILWLINIGSALLVLASGMFSAWTGVAYGMISFGLIFMGMMFVLPSVFINHSAAEEPQPKEETIYLQNMRHV